MASKTYSEFKEILTAKRNERLASLPNHRTILTHEERMEIFKTAARENSNEEELNLMFENLKNFKPEETKNDNT
jgi:hypothetical protein